MKPIVKIFNAKVVYIGEKEYLFGRVLGHPIVKNGHKVLSSEIINKGALIYLASGETDLVSVANPSTYETLNTIYKVQEITEAERLLFNLIDEVIERIGGL